MASEVYSKMTIDTEYQSLYYTINRIIENRLASLNTCIPAHITRIDRNRKLCDVQPLIKKRYKEEANSVNLPVIHNVPILFPQTSTSIISLPLKKYDNVLLVFSQRSLEEWKMKGGIQEPIDKRKHDLNDAVAIVGILPQNQGIPITDDSIQMVNKLFRLEAFEDGKLKVENGIYDLITILNELVTELKNFSQEISNITTIVAGAPVPPTNLAQLILYVTKFNILLSKFDTFKK